MAPDVDGGSSFRLREESIDRIHEGCEHRTAIKDEHRREKNKDDDQRNQPPRFLFAQE